MLGERTAALAALHREILEHRPCGSEPCETAAHLVPGEGPVGARVMIVGEAPGAQEDRQGRPFVGAAGRLVGELLGSVGLAREDVFVTNVLKARPPGNRDPKPPEVAHHGPWLHAQLELVDPELVVALGRFAMGFFLPGLKITQARGTPWARGGRLHLPVFHPSAALRTPERLVQLREDFARVPALLEARATLGPEVLHVDVPTPVGMDL